MTESMKGTPEWEIPVVLAIILSFFLAVILILGIYKNDDCPPLTETPAITEKSSDDA